MDISEKNLHPFWVLSQRGERNSQDYQVLKMDYQPQGTRAGDTKSTFVFLCRNILRSPLFGWVWRDEKLYVEPTCTLEEVQGRSR